LDHISPACFPYIFQPQFKLLTDSHSSTYHQLGHQPVPAAGGVPLLCLQVERAFPLTTIDHISKFGVYV